MGQVHSAPVAAGWRMSGTVIPLGRAVQRLRHPDEKRDPIADLKNVEKTKSLPE
jgi:hypothetical protein